MKRIVLLFIATSLLLFGMSYSQFKQSVLQHSKILQSKRLSLSAVQQENKILLRAENPALGLEASQFNPEIGDNRLGYRAAAFQSIRTGGFYGALEQKAQTQASLQQAYFSQGRSGFIKELERIYTQYVYQDRLVTLLEEEYRISQRVATIAKTRYESGAESKVQYIQAKTDAMMVKTNILSAKRTAKSIYYQMLGLSGFNREISLQKKFIYPLSLPVTASGSNSPLSNILSAQKENFASEVEVNDRSIKSYSLLGELEKEPDQSIARIGISVPIPLFNQNREEKALATIKMRQAELDQEYLQANETMQREALVYSIRELTAQYQSLQVLEKEQKELMELFEEGYRISRGSLLDLMLTKQKLVNTWKSLLSTHKMVNYQRIELNYLQGKYNE